MRAVRRLDAVSHVSASPNTMEFGFQPIYAQDIKSVPKGGAFVSLETQRLRLSKSARCPRRIKKERLCLSLSFAPSLRVPDKIKKCGRRDLNPYGVLHTPLKRARLPVPPLPHIGPHPPGLLPGCSADGSYYSTAGGVCQGESEEKPLLFHLFLIAVQRVFT